MNRILVVSGIAAVLALTTPAQQKTDSAKTTEVQVGDGKQVKSVAPQPLPPQTAPLPPNPWFPVVEQDLGTFFNHEEAVGHFRFKNPRKKAVEWKNLLGSCQCSKAVITLPGRKYELTSKPQNTLVRVTRTDDGPEQRDVVQQVTVQPEEEGEIEVHMEMTGISGPKQATIDIHTNDAELPMLRLRWTATGAQMFLVSPAEVSLNAMTWAESREFTVTVTSPVQKDFNIVRMDETKDFDVKWEKALVNGLATWTIRGKYGPITSEGPTGGGVLKFTTDAKNDSSFLVRVMAMVKGPMEVKPGSFVAFGRIAKGTSRSEKIVFEPNDGQNLEATALRFEKLTLEQQFITAKTTKDGNKLVVEIEVSKDAPPGLVRGDLVVELNHPHVKEKRLMFNGFVR